MVMSNSTSPPNRMGEVGRLWKRLHGKRIKTEKSVRDYFFYYSSQHPSAVR